MTPKATILTPTVAQIEQLRTEFFNRLERDGSPCQDGFHPKDIERIKTTDIWLQRFLEQHDLDMKAALDMLWETCEWRQNYGTNDITLESLNAEYMNAGLMFPRNRDIDGKSILILKSKLHIRGLRNTDELIRCFIYWVERMDRESHYDVKSVFFDLAGTGFKNLDLDYTRRMVHLLECYYPNNLNYIFVFELPRILTAAFNIIKALLPPKAVDALRFVNSKNLHEYISRENMLTCWGGTDDYVYEFVPEKADVKSNGLGDYSYMNGNGVITVDENDNTTVSHSKKVHFAKDTTDETSSDQSLLGQNNKKPKKGKEMMLHITPAEIIPFSKSDNALVGTVEIQNVVKHQIAYKIKTTSPEKFRVKPSSGILAPGESVKIVVNFQSGPNVTLLLSRDKFLVMCMEMTDSYATPNDIAEIWKNIHNSSVLVEQRRLKCSIGPNVSMSSNVGPTDIWTNDNVYTSNDGFIDTDRQWLHVTNSVSQLVESTRRLEARIKFNQKFQWITVLVFLLVSIIYIVKDEINNNSDYCMKSSRGYK